MCSKSSQFSLPVALRLSHLSASIRPANEKNNNNHLYTIYIRIKAGRSLVSFTSLVISSDNVNRGLVLLLLLCLIYKPGHNLVCKLILINRSPPPPLLIGNITLLAGPVQIAQLLVIGNSSILLPVPHSTPGAKFLSSGC